MESDESFSTARSLAEAADVERRMAGALTTPAWYAPGYGACLGLFVAAAAMLGAGWGLAAWLTMIVYALLLGTLVLAYRRTVRAWPRTTFRTGLATAVIVVLVIGLFVAYLSTAWWNLPWLAVGAVLTTGLTGAVLSRRWDAAWAREHGRR